jgi:hypothetical protein
MVAALMALTVPALLTGCDQLAGLLGDSEENLDEPSLTGPYGGSIDPADLAGPDGWSICRTFFVSEGSGDDSYDGTRATPYKTLDRALVETQRVYSRGEKWPRSKPAVKIFVVGPLGTLTEGSNREINGFDFPPMVFSGDRQAIGIHDSTFINIGEGGEVVIWGTDPKSFEEVAESEMRDPRQWEKDVVHFVKVDGTLYVEDANVDGYAWIGPRGKIFIGSGGSTNIKNVIWYGPRSGFFIHNKNSSGGPVKYLIGPGFPAKEE